MQETSEPSFIVDIIKWIKIFFLAKEMNKPEEE
jgi:hypothetical protein